MRLQVERTTASQLVRPSRAASRAPAPVGVDGDALPQLDGRLAVRDADEREPHEAKWVRGRTTRDEREARHERGREPPAAQAHLPAQEQAARVQHPDGERDRHRDVERRLASKLREPDDDARPTATTSETATVRADEAVERLERRQAQAQEAGVPLLQPALLPEVERPRARPPA